jgi:acetolactate synthase-1/2/3 large subunit
MKSGAQILVESLRRQGVSTIFGYPGAAVLPIYDELYSSPLRHILVRHEQAAAHAADGYARASGRTAVCLATSGPGACNLVTGIATAYMDSSPVVAITGQVATHLIGNDAFQEADITGITMPVTKHGYLVKKTEDLGRVLREAFHIAGTGRKGPVLIDIPKDVSMNRIFCEPTSDPFSYVASEDRDPSTGVVPGDPGEYGAAWISPLSKGVGIFGTPGNDTGATDPFLTDRIRHRGYRPTVQGNLRQIAKAADMITNAERPLIYAGGGVIASDASQELVRLAERMIIPVTATLMGLGCIPGDHPLNLGMLGMHGTAPANYAVTECDLLIAIGARFDDRVTGKLEAFAPHAQVIHIDIDPAEIGKIREAQVPVVGDCRSVLHRIFALLDKGRSGDAWRQRIAGWKQQHPLRYRDDGLLHPQFIIKTLSDMLGGDSIIVTEVGQHQMFTAQHYCFRRPRQLITSGGLGTMGFGLPAAIGAHFARPDLPVIDISGDGSLQMNIQEFGTIVHYKIPVKIVVMNNLFLGMVRQWQELFLDRRYSFTELPPVDFVRIAEAYGISGIRVVSPDEVVPALKTALSTDGPFLIDCRIEREDNVFPMVPAGAANDEMIGLGRCG